MADRPQPSADGPGGGQPVLAPGLRHRDRQDGRGLRCAGRAAQPSRAPGLAGGPVPRGRLGRQAVHEAAGDVGHLSPVVAGDARNAGEGPGQPACWRAGRGSGSTPRCSATRRFSSAGCWSRHVGGPSVKPPQPSGLWEAVAYTDSNTAHFKADTGVEKVHRRSFYTFWKRTSPPPQMTTFDAPSREACQVRRERTNTPLQALLLMNEPQFIEAARGPGRAHLARGGCDDRRPPGLHVPAGDLPLPRTPRTWPS